jgi:uncharacterized protein YndB with AHSA1/START domain
MIAQKTARTEDAIIAEVSINAPKSVVWLALTEPRMLASWWGSPETYRADSWTIDLRVGGKWSSRGTSNDGTAFGVDGEFVTINPTDRLVMTWVPSWDPASVTTTIDYQLFEEGRATRLRMTHAGFAGHAASRDNHAYGWERVLGWLGTYAERQAGAA